MINSKQELEQQLRILCEKTSNNIDKFGEAFPGPNSTNGSYKTIENNEWTTSFWTGILFICYEFSGDNKFLDIAEKNCESFINRLNYMHHMDHHDIGFLYSLSLVAGYKVTGKERYREYALESANRLVERINVKGKFIPAWSFDNGSSEVRSIIDSLMNIPLLYWAYEETNDEMYKIKADEHADVILTNLVREDYTTYHTYYFDRESGKPLYGATHQGYTDDSCWSRGQAWTVNGLALMERYNTTIDTTKYFDKVVDVFEKGLPANNVPYWDFYFNDENPSERDTSASAIAMCGLMYKFDDEKYYNLLERLFNGLQEYVELDVNKEGILREGVYHWHHNFGVGEYVIWGDYFYLETLYKLYNRRWNKYF